MFKMAILKLEQGINMDEVADTRVNIGLTHTFNINLKVPENNPWI